MAHDYPFPHLPEWLYIAGAEFWKPIGRAWFRRCCGVRLLKAQRLQERECKKCHRHETTTLSGDFLMCEKCQHVIDDTDYGEYY